MPTFEVEIGADFGAQAIVTDGVKAAALVDKRRRMRIALQPSPPYLASVRLQGSDVDLDGGIIATDGLGGLPRAQVTVTDVDAEPEWLWVQPVGVPAGSQWRRIRTYGAAGDGDGGGGGGGTPATMLQRSPVGWRWTGPDLVSGREGPRFPVVEASRVTLPARLIAIGGVSAADVVVQWRKRSADTGVVTDLGSPVTLPSGQAMAAGPAVSDEVPVGEIWPVLLSAPPAGVGGATAVTKVAQAAYTSGTSTGKTHVLPLPAGGAAGDLVVALVSVQAPTPTMGTAWTRRAAAASVATGTTSPHSRTVVFTAAWVTGMDMTVTLDPYTPPGGTTVTSSPCIATVLLLRGADLDQPIGTVNTANPANSAGATVTIPATTMTSDADMALLVGSWRLQAGVSGSSATATAGGTELADAATTRDPATNTNVGQAVYDYGAVASGASFTAKTVTVAVTAGAASTLSTSAALVTIRRKPGTTAPTEIDAWLWLDVERTPA